MNIRWTKPFTQNLESARLYIAAEDPKAALVVLMGTIDTLARFPEAGKGSNQVIGTRQILVPNTPFLISYRIKNNTVELLALWHHAQKWP